MAQSTTIKNAKDLYITVDGTSICGSVMGAEFSDSRQNSSYFTACGDAARWLTGKREVSGTINAYYSETAAEAFLLLLAAYENDSEITLVLAPLGNTSGNQQWTMTALVTESPLSFDASGADPISIAFPFVVQGTPTRATIS